MTDAELLTQATVTLIAGGTLPVDARRLALETWRWAKEVSLANAQKLHPVTGQPMPNGGTSAESGDD